MAFQNDDERNATLVKLGITEPERQAARAVVTDAAENKGNVNAGKEIFVTQAGQLNEKLHGRDIYNFPDIKQAAMIAQQAIDMNDAVARIEAGEHNAELGAKRIKIFGDENDQLVAAKENAARLNTLENDETSTEVDASIIAGVRKAYADAASLFEAAGQKQAADNLRQVSSGFSPQSDIDRRPGGVDAEL